MSCPSNEEMQDAITTISTGWLSANDRTVLMMANLVLSILRTEPLSETFKKRLEAPR